MKDPQAMQYLLGDIGDNSGLRKIVRQTQRLAAMGRILQGCLPENLRGHCQVAQMLNAELVILVDSAAWLTHLRYLKPKLLLELKKYPQYAYLQDLQYRIQPVQVAPVQNSKPQTGGILSAESREVLKNAAESVSDPQLKRALFKCTAHEK